MIGHSQGESATKKVLIVEDEKDICEALAQLMRRPGLEVITAYTVGEGLRLARAGGVDLIILDNWLGSSSGVELCRQIREFDTKTRILFYSAAAYDKDREEGLRAGADGYIVKPDFEQFQRTVIEMLSQKSES